MRRAIRLGGRGAEACFALWHSWEDGALLRDKAGGAFADPAKVHFVDYAGKWTRTRRPLTTPRSPQGHPAIMQAGNSKRGRDFGARWGEVIFTLPSRAVMPLLQKRGVFRREYTGRTLREHLRARLV